MHPALTFLAMRISRFVSSFSFVIVVSSAAPANKSTHYSTHTLARPLFSVFEPFRGAAAPWKFPRMAMHGKKNHKIETSGGKADATGGKTRLNE